MYQVSINNCTEYIYIYIYMHNMYSSSPNNTLKTDLQQYFSRILYVYLFGCYKEMHRLLQSARHAWKWLGTCPAQSWRHHPKYAGLHNNL